MEGKERGNSMEWPSYFLDHLVTYEVFDIWGPLNRNLFNGFLDF